VRHAHRRPPGPRQHTRYRQALLAVVQRAYVLGASTRRVDQLVERLGLRISSGLVRNASLGLSPISR